MNTDNSTEHLVRIAELEMENRMLKEQIEALKEQQQFDREQIKQLTKEPPRIPYKKWW